MTFSALLTRRAVGGGSHKALLAAGARHRFFQPRTMAAAGAQPEPQSAQAELFGEHPKGKQGWEETMNWTYGVSAVILVATVFAPDSNIQMWARDEARVRLKLQAEGKLDKPEFGTHYNTAETLLDFAPKKAENPFDEEDDDDEDDDDEDENDEAEDDDE